MIEVCRFFFDDPWHFLGLTVLVIILSRWHFVYVDNTVLMGATKELLNNDEGTD